MYLIKGEKMDKVRVARILVYEGPRDWVEETLKCSEVPLEGIYLVPGNNDAIIKSTLIDKFSEIIEQVPESIDNIVTK